MDSRSLLTPAQRAEQIAEEHRRSCPVCWKGDIHTTMREFMEHKKETK
jgi:hypothetical protein